MLIIAAGAVVSRPASLRAPYTEESHIKPGNFAGPAGILLLISLLLHEGGPGCNFILLRIMGRWRDGPGTYFTD